MSNQTFKELVKAKGFTPYSLAREAEIAENTARELFRGETRSRRAFSVKKAIADAIGEDLETVQAAIDQTRKEAIPND